MSSNETESRKAGFFSGLTRSDRKVNISQAEMVENRVLDLIGKLQKMSTFKQNDPVQNEPIKRAIDVLTPLSKITRSFSQPNISPVPVAEQQASETPSNSFRR